MEHSPILPASAAPAPFAALPFPVEVQSALALHGLRELLFAPIPVLAEALADLNKEQLGQAIEVMIAMLDATDGDPDAEADDRGGESIALVDDDEAPDEDGEEDPDLEQTRDEDDWFDHAADGPGCPISDAGGQCDEDGLNTHSMSGGTFVADDLDCGLTPDWGIDQTRSLPDAMVIASEREASNPHRNRIRDTKCVPIERRYGSLSGGHIRTEVEGYRLIVPPIVPTRRQLLTRKKGVPSQPRA